MDEKYVPRTVGDELAAYVHQAWNKFTCVFPLEDFRQSPPSVFPEVSSRTLHSWSADMIYLGADVLGRKARTGKTFSDKERCFILGTALAGHAHLLIHPEYPTERGNAYMDGRALEQTRTVFCMAASLTYAERFLDLRAALGVRARLRDQGDDCQMACELFDRLRTAPEKILDLGRARNPADQTALIETIRLTIPSTSILTYLRAYVLT